MSASCEPDHILLSYHSFGHAWIKQAKSLLLNEREANHFFTKIIYWYIIRQKRLSSTGHETDEPWKFITLLCLTGLVLMGLLPGGDGLPGCERKSASLCFYLDGFWCHHCFLVNLIIWSEHLNERFFSASISNKPYSCFWNPYELLCASKSCISFIGNEFVLGPVSLS